MPKAFQSSSGGIAAIAGAAIASIGLLVWYLTADDDDKPQADAVISKDQYVAYLRDHIQGYHKMLVHLSDRGAELEKNRVAIAQAEGLLNQEHLDQLQKLEENLFSKHGLTEAQLEAARNSYHDDQQVAGLLKAMQQAFDILNGKAF